MFKKTKSMNFGQKNEKNRKLQKDYLKWLKTEKKSENGRLQKIK
jgi:hypothetical protein